MTKEVHASWRHQLECRTFVHRLWHGGRPGAMLALEPGTGKTKLAIDLAGDIGANPVLVLCPMRIVEVWRRQLELHAGFPYLFCGLDDRAGSVAKKTSLARDAIALARASHRTAFIVINYEAAWREPFSSFALNTAWPLVIADEVHRCKSASGRISRFMGRLSRRAIRRLGLTGTPLPHSMLDIWAQYRFLDPGIFDETYYSFKMRYAIWGGFQNREIKGFREQEDFNRRFYSIAFRVTKEQALPDLPPEMDQTLYAELTPKGRQTYNELETNLITWLGEAPEEEITVKNALVLLLRLQQLTGGALKDDTGEWHSVDTAKEELLTDWLEDLPRDEPAVIFARFKPDLAAIRRACEKTGHVVSEVSGDSPHGIGPLQAGKANILSAQIQAASEGQDLTRARYCAFYSMGFSLYQYVQARARIHRAGQTRPTTYYHLLCHDTVDEIILHAVQHRWEIVETVLKEKRKYAVRTTATRP
jgi:SNF2 family DNA or RNA helicase